MKAFIQIIRFIRAASFIIAGCALASSASAQDVSLRVIPSGDAGAIPYLPARGFDFDGLRYIPGIDTLNVPLSTSITGSRLVVTLLLPVDRARADRRNIFLGFAPILAPGAYTMEIVERGVTVPERRSAPVSFTVANPTEASVPAFSVFDRKIKKFFLTAKASDVASLVASNTTNGPEWMPLEDNIRVWTTPQPFTVPVCRLYVPASGTHFFSADEYRDCSKLRGLPGFVDEGTAFHVIAPYRAPDLADFGGPRGKFINVCPVGTDPVYRMFDRTPGHAAHRYSTNPDVVDGFLGDQESNFGYLLEGVAFCSPRE